MAVAITFYTFAKKKNSLKLPTGATSRTYNCVFKEATDIMNPVIELDTAVSVSYNYAYVPSVGRYYFVKDWTSETNDIWSASLVCDVLATWRTEILASYQYVVRNQSKYNLEVPDNMYPMIDGVEYSVNDFGSSSPFTPVSGDPWRAILGIAGKGGEPFNGISYYQIGRDKLLDLMNILFDPNLSIFTSQGETFDVSNATMKALIQPLQYVPVCYAIPYDLTAHGASASNVTSLYVGFWETAFASGHVKRASASMGAQFFQIYNYTFNLPTRSLETQPLGTWASKLPYTEYKLFAGPFGQISIDTSKMNLTLGNSVTAKIKADLYGNCILTLEDGSGNIIYRGETNVSVPFRLTSLAINDFDQGMNVAQGFLQMGAGGASMAGAIGQGNIAGAVGGGLSMASSALSTIQNYVHSQFPTPLNAGSVSNNLAQVLEPWRLQTCFHKIASEDREHFGRPLSERIQLSDGNLSGYTVCANATIEITGTLSEQEQIISYLNSGFYKE